MEVLQEHQLNIMLFMSGVCFVLAILTLMPKFMSRRRRIILCFLEFASMFLLIFDRLAYQFRGDASEFGGKIVRTSNGMVFFLTLLIPLLVAHFLHELYRDQGSVKKALRRLVICDVLFLIGTILIVVSQFTGLYYSFDAQNNYIRSPGFVYSYIIPFLIILIQETLIIQYRKALPVGFVITFSISVILPAVAGVAQFFLYGLSLLNMTMIIVSIVFYIYSLCSLGAQADQAKTHELEVYIEARRREEELFDETTQALVNAVDAKDRYTHGHSTRVAVLSRAIAKEAGFSEEECKEVYLSALLHDIGKIGIRYEVLNKPDRLTDEEYELIKNHTVYGYQILSSIKLLPYLSVGAHYHHERYDGTGYPEGLKGEEIPPFARIIAVADAYDTMRSNRKYRKALPIPEARAEIANGMGSQFDYEYAAIMLRLIDSGAEVTRGNPEAEEEDEPMGELLHDGG